MAAIRITAVPPGFAPESIRQQWVGVELPLATEDELRANPLTGEARGNENIGGHLVLRSKAVIALRAANKREAARYWESLPMGFYLRFRQDVCALVA